MTRDELKKKYGKRFEEIEAHVKRQKGKSPDAIVAAVQAKYPDCIPADILILVPAV